MFTFRKSFIVNETYDVWNELLGLLCLLNGFGFYVYLGLNG